MKKVLYIYRSKESGPSIRRVFEPIERELSSKTEVDSLYLPKATASPFAIISNMIYVKKYIKEKKYDIIHITGHVHYILFILLSLNTVLTVHDLGFYLNLNRGLKKVYLYLFFIYPLKFAKRITYISNESYDEANNILKLSPHIQSVIYNPVNPSFKPNQNFRNCANPVILHIGTKVNKNLLRVIQAVSTLKCTLHVIGKIPQPLRNEIEKLNIILRNQDFISDDEVVTAYQNCDIVCFPSLYEGFGMPIIEGQATGRPIVTSDIPPMNIIAGEGAVFVNPYSVESIREGIQKALENKEQLIQKGYDNVKKFSITHIAEEYMRIYDSIIHR